MVISTKHGAVTPDAGSADPVRYPPPAQVMSVLLNAIFLDVLDQDVRRIERLNSHLERTPSDAREDFRPIKVLMLRPLRDLGQLARDYEPQLPRGFRYLTRGLGTRDSASPDALSLVLFQSDYLCRLMDEGESDADARAGEIEEFLSEESDPSGGHSP